MVPRACNPACEERQEVCFEFSGHTELHGGLQAAIHSKTLVQKARKISLVWWNIAATPAPWRQRQEDGKFKASESAQQAFHKPGRGYSRILSHNKQKEPEK